MSSKTTFPQLIERIEDWPIFRLHKRRTEFVQAIETYTFDRMVNRHTVTELTELLTRAAYQERIRIKEDPWKVDPPEEEGFWKKISQELAGLKTRTDQEYIEQTVRGMLERIIHRYAEEIVGTFHKKTFLFARKFLTTLFKWLLNAAAGSQGKFFWGTRRELHEKLEAHGPLEDIRQLCKDHILVVLPTHFSNLDSILVGYAMDGVLGLPSFSYGAGLNLYNFGPAAYYMNRLGAYRVDRRKKNQVYLETLKAMSRLSMEWGTNSLFFPGGTRSRSGALEEKLKLGLLGTTLEAQRSLIEQGDKRKIVIVPLIMSYHFVLEAKFLIDSYLRKTGREQYLRTRDHSFSIRKLIRFTWQFFAASSDITLSFGQPMDVLGNRMDADGHSYDRFGKTVDLKEYFFLDGNLVQDAQRESEYTRLLAEKIVQQYHRENMVLSSHLVAFAAFEWFRKQNAQLDLFGCLRLPTEDFSLSVKQFEQIVAPYREQLLIMENAGQVKVTEILRQDLSKLVSDGIKKLGIYHAKKPLKIQKSGTVISQDFALLYYYHNRLAGFGLEST